MEKETLELLKCATFLTIDWNKLMNLTYHCYIKGLSSLYPTTKHDPERPKIKKLSSMDRRERKSHARGVYLLAHGNSKSERKERRHKNSTKRLLRNFEERKVSEEVKSPKVPNQRRGAKY